MPVPVTSVELGAITLGVEGYTLLLNATGDMTPVESFGLGGAPFIAGIADLNGDLVPEVVIGAPGDDDKAVDAGRVFVSLGDPAGPYPVVAGDPVTHDPILDGVATNDFAGMVIGTVADLNADGRAEILVGAPFVNRGGSVDPGVVYVTFGVASGGVDLNDINTNAGGGFGIRGEAAGDRAGSALGSVADLTGDGRSDILVGATGNDAGGADAGAAYVVFGKATTPSVNLAALGTAGWKIIGENAGDQAGVALTSVADMNGDGKAEVLVGAAFNDAGGTDAGAAYVVFGKATTAAVNLDDVALGAGGFKVIGPAAGALTGAVLAAAGDLNGDGRGDVVIGAPGIDEAFVVFGKADGLSVDLADVEAGIGGYAIHAENPGDFDRMALAAGTDLNRDGVADIVIGAPMADGGMGAVYVVWGGGTATVELSEVAASHGGAKVWGLGGHTGAAVAINGDMNGDGAAELIIASPGAGVEQVTVLYAPDSWQPDNNVYGSDGADVIAAGYGALHKVGEGADAIFAFAGDDSVAAGGGDDSVEAGDGADTVDAGSGADTVLGEAGLDSLVGGDGADSLDGGADADTLDGGADADTLDGGGGADAMSGGTGDDLYFVDNAGDAVTELSGGGSDTVIASVDHVLAAEVEVLVLTGAARHGTGNALDNAITGTAGNDVLEGGGGADTLDGGLGNDRYRVDSAFDLVIDAGGNDTVEAATDYTLGTGIEALTMTAPGHLGTGNGLGNTMLGSSGADTLDGGAGNDTIDGGGGADRMIGGSGDDLFRVNDPGDVVVEEVGGGNDTVEITGDWTIADNIETVVLVGGGAHALTGNAGNNGLVGSTGNDTLDGGDGDDQELGGAGDDVLISHAGHDTLAGGSGDDRYKVHGGRVHIEDQLGHDTLDASEATGDSYIDLEGETISRIENEDCEIGQGGSTALPLDVQFLQDVTGSFADDIAGVRLLVPNIVAALQAVQTDAEFGVSTFRDKPIGSFGGVGDWVYQQALGLSTSTTALTAAYTAMVANNGADAPEAQIEALMQLALHTADVGFRATSARFVVLFTDASFHQAGDGAAAGITLANNGDAILDGTPPGTGEDYPAIAQVRAALEAANIIPIFAATVDVLSSYGGLVTALGRGAAVELTANSSNIVAAITAGLTAVTVTHVEDALGGVGNDTILGSTLDNSIAGGAGNDSLDGKDGKDSLDGGAGHDILAGGAGANLLTGGEGDDTATGADGTDTLDGGIGNDSLDGGADADSLLGGDGNDTLDGGLGADVMDGGKGNDRYVVDDPGDVIVDLRGLDTVVASLDWTLARGLENLELTGAAVKGAGNSAANLITGNAEANLLAGAIGNDTLLGGDGADTLGGGAGDDVLVGGAGSDRLTGGAGADIFRFLASSDAGDKVQDFVTGVDAIELSAAGFGGGLVAGMDLLATGHLVLGKTATASVAQVLLDVPAGRIYWDVDGTGTEAKVLLALLTHAPTIVAGDIHVIA